MRIRHTLVAGVAATAGIVALTAPAQAASTGCDKLSVSDPTLVNGDIDVVGFGICKDSGMWDLEYGLEFFIGTGTPGPPDPVTDSQNWQGATAYLDTWGDDSTEVSRKGILGAMVLPAYDCTLGTYWRTYILAVGTGWSVPTVYSDVVQIDCTAPEPL